VSVLSRSRPLTDAIYSNHNTMATASISPPSLIDHHEREPPSSSRPPSSFEFSKITNGHNSSTFSYSSASASNVANALNTRPVYDRSTSRLSRYDSKRSSIISNTSFQTAPGFADPAYGGGSNYGGGTSLFGRRCLSWC
jgi:hypothetical protein